MITTSGTIYSVYLSNPFGVRLADASDFIRLELPRVVNSWSTLTLTLPPSFDTRLLRVPDGRIEVWRRIPGAAREYLEGECVWLIRRVQYTRDAAGTVTLVVEADHPLSILREPGRFVDAYAGTAAASESGAADDVMKTIVKEQAGSSATDSNRDLSALISVAPNFSLGPTVTRSFAWRAVLNVLQDLAQDAAEQDTYVAFDIVSPTPDTMQFRTYTGQRGVDHRFPGGQNPVILSPEFGNLAETTLDLDYRDEVTYAKVGGKGEESERKVQSAQDDTRIGLSPFGRRERFIDYTNTDTLNILAGVARAHVRAGRPRAIFSGKIINTRDTQYGVHWAFGDFVTAQDFGYSFDCRIDAVTITVENGEETIAADLRAETIFGTSGRVTTADSALGQGGPRVNTRS